MRPRTLVFIACSPQPRAGVSTTARLLTDYFLSRGQAVGGFDADPRDPRYFGWFPDMVSVVDAADIKGQIALFDRLLENDGVPKVVDVWSRSYDQFFATIREIGFIEEARRNGVEPIVLFHASSAQRTLSKALDLRAQWRDLWMFAVHNEGAAPLGAYAREILPRYPVRGKFVIAPLEGPVARALDDPDLSLSRFLLAPPADMSIVVRAALKAWITPVFTQFQSFELRLALESSSVLR